LGRFTRAALSSNDRLVLVTYDSDGGDLVQLREREGGELELRTVAGRDYQEGRLVQSDAGQWVALALDAQDRAHVAYYVAVSGHLEYRILEAGEPEIVDGDQDWDRGTHVSMALAADGTVHLAYRDETARALRYATRVPSGAWSTEPIGPCTGEPGCPVAGLENYGEYASLQLVAGLPRIVFYDRLRGDLKLAERLPEGGWTTTTLDGRDPATGEDTGDVGRFAVARLDSKRRLGIAYYDATRGALRYLHAGSVALVVDDGAYSDPSTRTLRHHLVGQHVGLAFDAADRAWLVYLDATRLRVKRAQVQGTAVLLVEDLPELGAGGHVGIAVSAAGRIRGGYAAWAADDTVSLQLLDLPTMGPL
jgi:hypothetical protein